MRPRLQLSVELPVVTRTGDHPTRSPYINSIEVRTWEPPSVPRRRLLARGMRLPMLTPSWTKCWRNSRPWQRMGPGRCDRGQSRRWPERRCARPSWRSGVLVSVACSGGPSDCCAPSPSARFTRCSPGGPGWASGGGCSTGCAAPGGARARMVRNRAPWSSIVDPVARRRAVLSAASRRRSMSRRRTGMTRKVWLLWRLLLIWAESDRSKDKILGHDLLAQGLQSTAPAKVIGQVLRRDAMEGTQPFLEAAVVGIDVVDVEIGCLRVGLAGHWQDVGWDASPAGEGNDRGATVATEFVGCRDDTAKRRCNRHSVQFCQHRIRGRTMTVSCHENRNLFGGNPALGRFAASLAGLARHAGSPAFERFQNEGFVAFDDPRQRFGLVAGQRNQKPMSPAKCRGVVHVASFRGLGDADTVDHGLGLCQPFVLHPQTGQRRVRQGVERTLTAFATVAWQSARLAPMHDIEAVAMRATDAVNSALPKFSNDIGSKPVQRPHHRRWRERRRLIRRCRRTAGGNVHAPRRTGLDVIAIRSLGQGQRLPSLSPLRRRQCRDTAQPAVKLRHVHGSLLASQESAIADTNNQRHESQG